MDPRGTFREVERGDVTFPVNSSRMAQDRFIDQSRMGTHEEWRPGGVAAILKKPARKQRPGDAETSVPGYAGRIERVVNSVCDNARQGMDAMKHRTSFRDEQDTHQGDAGCLSDSCYREGPLTRKRGDA